MQLPAIAWGWLGLGQALRMRVKSLALASAGIRTSIQGELKPYPAKGVLSDSHVPLPGFLEATRMLFEK